MKKIYLTLMLLLAVTGFQMLKAQTPKATRTLPKLEKCKGGMKVSNPEIAAQFRTPNITSKVEDSQLTGFNDYVPEGEKEIYSLDGMFYNYFDMPFYRGFNTKVVFTDDNQIYLKSFFPFQFPNAHIMGTINGDTITIAPFTKIYEQDWNGNGSDVSNMLFVSFKPDSAGMATIGADSYKMVIKDDNLYPVDPDWYVGVYDSVSSQAYLYDYTIIDSLNFVEDTTPVSLPASAQPVKYFYDYNSSWNVKYKDLMNVYVDGNDYYFNNLDPIYPGHWVKGTRKGNVVEVPGRQYLGDSTYVQYFQPVQVVAAGQFLNIDTLKLTIDNDTLKSDSLHGVTESFLNGRASDYYMNDFKIYIYPGDVLAKPKNPYDVSMYTYPQRGYDLLYFSIGNEGTNGEYLNSENLFYRVYMNDTLYTFSPDKYNNLSEPTTNIMYNFNDGHDFNATGESHYFYVYDIDFQKIGVQIGYTVGGDTLYSDIAWRDANGNAISDGINEVQTSMANIVSKAYYDLSGRRILPSSNGIAIERSVFSDGTVRTRKVIRK